MGSPIKLSDAASLGIHAAVYLAGHAGRPVATREAAEWLSASEAHLAKVMQRMGHAGLVRSVRGPGGGFFLDRAPEDMSLLEVYEAVEGPLKVSECLFGDKPCSREKCIMGNMLATMNRDLREYLLRTSLADLVEE